jgi:site-specific DNA-methyltransferase (cytosine-N4-specific)
MTKRLTFNNSNQSQQYASHDFFRYFGKLPPVVVRHILEKSVPKNGVFLDLMCGSGTSLVECKIMGIESVGVDVNPLSILVSKVKTTPIDPNVLSSIADALLSVIKEDTNKVPLDEDVFEAPVKYLIKERPKFKNKSHWFTPYNEAILIILRHHIELIDNEDVRDFFRVAFFSVIRRSSRASARIGRVFLDVDAKPEDVLTLFTKRVDAMILGMADFLHQACDSPVRLVEVDARNTGLHDRSFDFILNHPPYFALYKYSSDVLRFELEWGNFARSPISRQEIREGFKTTELSKFNEYADDMQLVFQEAYRLLKPGMMFCVVVNDSTLRDIRLPVVDTFIDRAKIVGFSLKEKYIRDVMYSQARYHRSANPSIQTKEDQLIFFEKPV